MRRARQARAPRAGQAPEGPVRILRVIARMNIGGPAYHVSLLSGGLNRRRYETLLVAGQVSAGEAPLTDLADRHGARLELLGQLSRDLRPAGDAQSLARLIAVARRFQPHIVHTHTAKAGVLGRLAAEFVRPRPAVIHTYHGHVLEGYFSPPVSRAFRLMERSLARRSKALVGVSRATVDDLVRLGIAGGSKFRVVPIGLELDSFLSLPVAPSRSAGKGFREELRILADEILVTYVGRLVPIKRLDVTLRAVGVARERGARVRLAVVGDGPERPRLEVLAADLGLDRAAAFVGYRRDLPELVAASDVGVLSSDSEGTPVALIEFAAGARPVAATAVGGVSEVVAEGAGLLVPPGDHIALATAIERLSASSALRQQMGLAGREHVRVRFAARRLVRDIEALYEEVLAR